MATHSRNRNSAYGRYRTLTPEKEHKLREMEKLREEYLKRKREEMEREKALKSGGITLEINDVEFYAKQNALDHNTTRYDLLNSKDSPVILRRGQPFYICIRFKRNYDHNQDKIKLTFLIGPHPQVSKGTLIQLPVTKNQSFTKPKSQWDIRLHHQEPTLMHLQIQISSKAIVGVWSLNIETTHPNSTDPVHFQSNKNIYIIFNPWCKDDAVYMESELCRNEYVLNESGKIFVGSHKSPKGRRWIYGQFSSAALPAAMAILEASPLDYVGRANPVKVVRTISAMINSEDDNGVLKGRWDGSYEDGSAPWVWTGSNAILEEYLRNGGNAVKYGQCWVFAGVCTTVCRTLGIPCRPVTNFVSAHDTDDTLTIDKFFDPKGEKMELNDDSIWNYHVWNDCWMTRPDLPPGYGGWQAVDATPQETSDGIYQTGPASLEAVRRGEVGFTYDSPFVFSEVNADIIHWQKDDDLPLGWKKLKTNKYHVGRFILTKKAGVEDHKGDSDVENIINLYKNVEGTEEERIAIRNAATYGNFTELFDMPATEQEDVFFDMLEIDQIMIGEPFDIVMKIENRSNDIRTIFAVMSANTVYYTGINAHTVKKDIRQLVLKPRQKETLTINVSSKEYYDKLVDYSMMKIYAMATVKETKQTWTEEDDFAVEKPKLNLEISGHLQVGEPFELTASFANPLDRMLQDCIFIVEGPGLSEAHRFYYRDINPKETVVYRETFVPSKEGKRNIVVMFSSKQLIEVQGSMEVEVVP